MTALAIWKALTSPAGKTLAAFVAVAAVLAAVYFVGHHEGRMGVLDSLKDQRITILKDGAAIDNKAIGADDDALCNLLGGCS
jgi:hypothetical protein